jgi:hypothetical protein
MNDGEDRGEYVLDVLSATQTGMLPALTKVLITRWREAMYDKVLPFEQFQALGVTLEVKIVKQSSKSFPQSWSSS